MSFENQGTLISGSPSGISLVTAKLLTERAARIRLVTCNPGPHRRALDHVALEAVMPGMIERVLARSQRRRD